MRLTQIATVAAIAGLVNAQSACLSSALAIPTCALGYIASYAFNQLNCGLVDFDCYCSSANFAAISATALPAAASGVQGGCDANAAASAGSALCQCASANSGSVALEPSAAACATSAAAIPPCPLGIIVEAAGAFSCAFNDLNCQCSASSAIVQSSAGAILATCGAAAGADALMQAGSLCKCVTASPDAPGAPSSGPTGSSGPTTTETGPTGSPGPSPSGSGSQGPTQTGKGSSSSPGSKTTPPGSSQTGSKSTTGSTTTAPKQPNGPSTGGTKPMPFFTNAGASASAFGGAVGLVAGLVAFL